MGSTRPSILEILRNANSSVSVLRSCGSALPGRRRSWSPTDAVAAEASTLSQHLAREARKHAGGMKLRTGYANQHHGENLYALVIADNVISVHQSRRRWVKMRRSAREKGRQ